MLCHIVSGGVYPFIRVRTGIKYCDSPACGNGGIYRPSCGRNHENRQARQRETKGADIPFLKLKYEKMWKYGILVGSDSERA